MRLKLRMFEKIFQEPCYKGAIKMRYILFVCCLCLAGCAPTINCDDWTQMLSTDRDVRYRWLQQCRTVNKKVRVNGVEQVEPK